MKGRKNDMKENKASEAQVGGGHYKDMAIQPAEFCQKNKLAWCESNVIKYVCRHRDKNGKQDILKAIHYLNLLLEWEYQQESKPKTGDSDWHMLNNFPCGE